MWVPVSCERRALGLWLRVLGMKCSVPWLSCGEEGRVEVKRPWASELVCNFVHVPVSKEEPWLSLHSQECPRPEKGQSLHYPEPAAGTRGLGHLACPKTQDHPGLLGSGVEGGVPGWCMHVRVRNGHPGQAGFRSRTELFLTLFPP